MKLRRAELSYPHTIPDLFGNNLYVANMRRGVYEDEVLRHIFSRYGYVSFAAIQKDQVSGEWRV